MNVKVGLACLMMAAIVLPAGVGFAQTSAPAVPAATAGNPGNGQMLFSTDGCFECHNYGGTGGSAGPRVAKTALPFNAFLKQLRMPASQMPPFEATVVSDQQAADIYAYLETLPPPVDMSSITLPH